MIPKFVKKWDERKNEVETKFKEKHPEDYAEIVKSVIEILDVKTIHSDIPDPENIHIINDGDYQGTLLFIIPEKCYQPETYWSVKVSYGSCSGCDVLEQIKGFSSSEEKPTEEQVKDYMSLALHILQGLKEL